jgi:predicted phosphodiesterase
VGPPSEEILPAYVAAQDIEWALSLLAEFPAEPAADTPGDGGGVRLDPARIDQQRTPTNGSTGDQDATLLFVSDTHLGYERRSHTDSGDAVDWIETLSSEETFMRITSIAIERDVDAIIHTGDILDHEVDQETLDAAERLLQILADHEIPFYFIIGSHDHQAAQPKYHSSVNGVSWLKSQCRSERMTEVTTQPTPIGANSISVYGISADNIGIDAVGMNDSRGWHPSQIAFGASGTTLNILCLHDRVTTYRESEDAVDLDRLLSQSRVAFDLVLIGDEHRPKDQEFTTGYSFKTKNGTPVLYTGPAMRISPPYHDQAAFVTELSISGSNIETTRHTV